jgi:hypothetical protein
MVVHGTTSLGANVDQTITLTGQVFANATAGIIPSANGGLMGTTVKRWAGLFTTVGTSSTLAVGTDATVGANLTVSAAASVGTDLTVGDDINMANTSNIVFSNTGLADVTKTTITSNNISVDYMQVQKNLTFPDTITLIGQTLGSEELTVSNNAHFTGAGAANNSQPTVTFGSGTNTVFINTTAGRFNTLIRPDATNTNDVGSEALSWRTGYFDTSLVVGDTTANTTSVVTDNLYARNDIIGNYSSDENLKDNIVVLDDALNRIESISGYSFDWNSKIGDDREGTPDYGVLAQEIENILPNAVTTNGRGYKTVSYNAVIPLLVEAIKELSAKVDRMQAEREGEE